MADYKPFVPAETTMNDFNPKSVILGVILGAIFGSANAYLGLRVGLTISTAIPLAVLSVAIFRVLIPVLGKSTILECNISETVGSASSSLASGIIFTIPALFLWGYQPSLLQMTMLAICGGLIGVLFMIPLRAFLIKKEHDTLPYPEGTAGAEVLIAASESGASANSVFYGLSIGAIYKAFTELFYLWPTKLSMNLPFIKKAVVSMSTTPALLGVGYILGRRVGTIMVAGGLLSWVVIIPFIAWKFGLSQIWPDTLTYLQTKGLDPSIRTIAELSPKYIWEGYIRIIGAGAVAAAGIITVAKSVPTMIASLKLGLKEIRGSAVELDKGQIRTEQDLPLKYVVIGLGIIIMLLTFIPGILGKDTTFALRFGSALCITIFGFAFVTVSSRIVGLIGVSSNPTSGMAIVTLLGTGILFKIFGWTDITGKITALTIGTVVCVAASMAGDISQDLKTGFLVGATPRKQQLSSMIGVLSSALFVCFAVYYLGQAYGFGTDKLPAPQATLMKTILDGVLGGNLRWSLVIIGAAFTLAVHFGLKISPLPFAVGVYLPLETMTPVFLGGLIRHAIDKRYGIDKESTEKGKDQGILLSSGLIAGEGLMGVCIAFLAVIMGKEPKVSAGVISFIFFALLGGYLYSVAAKSRQSR
jgi:putative OPT family oligopeptide transporter